MLIMLMLMSRKCSLAHKILMLVNLRIRRQKGKGIRRKGKGEGAIALFSFSPSPSVPLPFLHLPRWICKYPSLPALSIPHLLAVFRSNFSFHRGVQYHLYFLNSLTTDL